MTEKVLPNHDRSQVPANNQFKADIQSEGFGGSVGPPFIEAGIVGMMVVQDDLVRGVSRPPLH